MKYLLSTGILVAYALAAQPNPGAGSIEGHVFNSVTSAPVRKATVTLTAPQFWLNAETDAAGMFQFTGLPPGIYKLSASQTGFFEHRARRPITLAQDGRVKDAKIRLPPQGVITGRVLDEDGDPMGGAHLAIFKQVYQDGRKQWERPMAGVAITSHTGEYRFSGLTPGRYLVRAESSRMVNNHYGDRDRPPTYYVPAYYPNVPSQQAASPVLVGVGVDIRGIDIHLYKVAQPPRFRVSGRVVGAPAGSEITIHPVPVDGAGFGGNTVAGPPDYTFSLNVPSGQYTFSASVFSGGPAAYARVSVTVAGELTDVVLTMSPAPEIAARISIADSGTKMSLQGVRVTLSHLPVVPVYEFGVRSDAAGKLTFDKPIPPGRYAIEVDRRTIPAGCYLQTVKSRGQEISADDFEILASTELEVVISNTAGTIVGSALDGDGKPFPGAAVTLIPTDEKSTPLKQSADDDGNFKLTGLRPGKYKLLAWEEVDDAVWQDAEFRKKYESRSEEITVGPRETQNAQLRLIPVEEMK
jgi:carboxypeptidase family protein